MLAGWLNSENELDLGKEMEKSHHKHKVIKSISRLPGQGKAWHTLNRENTGKILTMMEKWNEGKRKTKARVSVE